MTQRKPDRRVAKTKKAIRKAFVELLTEKHINDITVKDIADLADINRKTFYNYYSGIHELLEELENDMVSSFEKNLTDFDFRRDVQRPNRTFARLSAGISEDGELFRKLLRSKSNSHIVRKITDLIVEKAVNFLQEKYDLDRETLSVVTLFISGGLMNVYQKWVDSEWSMTIDEISSIISNILEHGVGKVLKIK